MHYASVYTTCSNKYIEYINYNCVRSYQKNGNNLECLNHEDFMQLITYKNELFFFLFCLTLKDKVAKFYSK